MVVIVVFVGTFRVRLLSLVLGMLIPAFLFDGCADDEGGDHCGPPIVNAGEDQKASIGNMVVLSGEVRLPPEAWDICLVEKEMLTFEWWQTEGPDAELTNALALEASFVPAETGIYYFYFTATYPVTEMNRTPMTSTPDVTKVTVQ
jgi:hypothetical protein